MTFLQALFLGALQGLTEFLPVSSSGHLVLLETWFGLHVESLLSFDVVVHSGTLVALVVYFRRELVDLVSEFLGILTGKVTGQRFAPEAHPPMEEEVSLVSLLVLATLPVVIVGPFAKDLLETVFRGQAIVVVMLAVTAVLLALAELLGRYTKDRPWSIRSAVVMGCFQVMAMIPGVSRSGSTIVGGMMMGLSREKAARFSFLMAIPAILGALVFLFKDVLEQGADGVGYGVLSVGFLSSAVVSFACIHFMLRFLRSRSLWVFVAYLGILVVGYLVL